MTVDYDNAFSQGIIGLQAKVLESPDSTLLGIAGTIVFETKTTIFIRKASLI